MLTVHRAERTATLAAALAEVLRTPLDDPFAMEVVAVPAKGVERWLTQRLSTVLGADGADDGICAGIEFPSAARLVDDVLAAASGTDPRCDPWRDPIWPLLEVIDGCIAEPWCAVLARHLGYLDAAQQSSGGAGGTAADHRRGRRFARAAHLAGLFRSYAASRPDMLRAWAAGNDTDGTGPLPADLLWQAELWRRLRSRLGPSPAERLHDNCERLRAEPELCQLPNRLSLFGPTRLSTVQLHVLRALAERRNVQLWVPHPSPALWAALNSRTVTHRRNDNTATVAHHPLLRSQARDVRELQLRLPTHSDVHHPGDQRSATLLGRLQADLRDDLPPSPAPPDGSLQVHACHGPARQVEVLRELLLGLFQDDPTLEPRDVLVMCPDVENFAPLISAVFGLGPELPHPGHSLRVRLADRSLRQTNPLLDTVARLLELAGSRVTASQVLDLAGTAPVRRRFGFDDDELERIRQWVARAGVRWGIDPDDRVPFGLGDVTSNTWRAGLDRVLLGVTTSEDEPVFLGSALPLDDVDSGDIDLAGRLAELIDRLDDVLDRLTGEHRVQHWVQALGGALEALTDTTVPDAWQLVQARRELAEAAGEGTSPVALPDVRAMLADRLRGRPTRANFRTGDLTVCTMVPMRSVPHRVVVLLGLDDGSFPRTTGVDGDDVLARDPRLGERDPRNEDRQLFLDAVLSAGERLVILYTGADPVSGAARPPAVPVGELLDVVATMVPGGRPQVAAEVEHRHPLQPYDVRNFTGDRPFSFDPVSLAGARRAAQPRRQPEPAAPLPVQRGPLELDDLIAFAEHPVRAFLRQRLRISLPGEDDEIVDALPIALDGLQKWAVGDRLLDAALRGLDLDARAAVEWRRGELPPKALGRAVMDEVQPNVQTLAEAAAPLLKEPVRAVDVRLEVAGRSLSGTVTAVRGNAALDVSYSGMSAKRRARAWVLALALAASGEGDRAVGVNRRGRSAGITTITAPPDPVAALAELIDLYDRGMREPLPLTPKASSAYATRRERGDSVEAAEERARAEWTSKYGGEWQDRYHEHVWGREAPFARLLAANPADDERWNGEQTRFGALACRFWAPVLAEESSA